MGKSKDLFDDSSMSFGEHLEILRVHLWKALIGLVLCVMVSLMFGQRILQVVQAPINKALADVGHDVVDETTPQMGFFEYLDAWWNDTLPATSEPLNEFPDDVDPRTIRVAIPTDALLAALHSVAPESFPEPGEDLAGEKIELDLAADEFRQLRKVVVDVSRPVTLNVQEAFMTYLKVSLVTGLVLGSPWIFYQLWLFVAAGLYPHERRYVHMYLPISIGLFLGGTFFCFFIVFPFVLEFLLSFNAWLGVFPQIRLSEWISFAIMLPVMFGLSFQLPLVMMFLERISIFEVADYREKRRIAVLVIAVLSMLMTPAEPYSMMAMMIPLVLLYEVGIWMCQLSGPKNPFDAEPA